jgi:microcompartment protein CcmK/EutM
MRLARVIGSVVSTAKHPNLEGKTLLLLQPITKDGHDRGEIVYWCRGREASLAFGPDVPTDAAVVGIVDAVTQG